MRIRLAAVGRRMPGWVDEVVGTYAQRLPRGYRFELITVPASKLANVDARKAQEGEKLLSAAAATRLVALDERGKRQTSRMLAQRLANWQQDAENITLVIGGADGLSDTLKAKAAESWALSDLTLPHHLARVMLVEALYRASTINSGHPYHRD